MGQALCCSAAYAGVWGKRDYSDGFSPHVTQQYHLASMAAWLSSSGISYHDLLLHIPSIHLFAINSSPCPRLFQNPHTPAPYSCTFQGTCIPVQGVYGCDKDCLILISLRLPQISCFTLCLKCFSSDSDNFPDVGIRPLLQFPHLLRVGPVLLTLLFSPLVPSSYLVFHSSIYSFHLVGYFSLLSTGVLHALLSQAVFLMHPGERCTPCPPTPLPFCSLLLPSLLDLFCS